MLDRYELKDLLRFLEQATEAELRARQAQYLKALEIVTSDDVVGDMRFRLRLVEQELCARIEVARARKIVADRTNAPATARVIRKNRK
jgi:hypothetical protein